MIDEQLAKQVAELIHKSKMSDEEKNLWVEMIGSMTREDLEEFMAMIMKQNDEQEKLNKKYHDRLLALQKEKAEKIQKILSSGEKKIDDAALQAVRNKLK